VGGGVRSVRREGGRGGKHVLCFGTVGVGDGVRWYGVAYTVARDDIQGCW